MAKIFSQLQKCKIAYKQKTQQQNNFGRAEIFEIFLALPKYFDQMQTIIFDATKNYRRDGAPVETRKSPAK